MKQLLILLTLVMTVSCTRWIAVGYTIPITSNIVDDDHISDSAFLGHSCVCEPIDKPVWADTAGVVILTEIHKDTLTIADTSIHFIRIGNELFGIIRYPIGFIGIYPKRIPVRRDQNIIGGGILSHKWESANY